MNELETDLRTCKPQVRDDRRAQMTLIVAQLARLEMQMKQLDPPRQPN